MKTIILAAVAASVVATAPAAAAPFNGQDNRGRIEQSFGSGSRDYRSDYGRDDFRNGYQLRHHRWNKGQRFDSRYARNYRAIGNPRAYHLRDAPRGYRWVQSGDDAVLIAITSGIIGAVLANVLN
jgi:Ni/Co efflux regulator RcnB